MSHLSVCFVTLVIQGGAIWPNFGHSTAIKCMGENRRITLSTTLHTSWERGRVDLIFSTNITGDVCQVMGHVPYLCVLCNPCYSR